jgi:hypothetical protein
MGILLLGYFQSISPLIYWVGSIHLEIQAVIALLRGICVEHFEAEKDSSGGQMSEISYPG